MLKKLAAALFMVMFVGLLSGTSLAQGEAKHDRVDGLVVRSNKDKSTLTVRATKTGVETTVNYDASTQWTSQYHGDKKANTIDANQVKDGDHVICLGSYEGNVLHATTISKRLSHSH